MKLKDRVALVTGAGAGIGRAAALALAAEGARVGVLDYQKERADSVTEEITRSGGEALAIAGDVSQPDDVKAATERVVDAWGRLDVLFANAGINGVWSPIEETEVADWDQLMNVNLKGSFLSLKYAIPHLRKQGGSVIITSSVQGTSMFSIAGSTAYACTKAAQVALVKKAALELARDKIRVNAIRPGHVATSIGESTFTRNTEKITFPVVFPEGAMPLTKGKPLAAEDIANVVLFLASDESAGITGADILVDAGSTLVMG